LLGDGWSQYGVGQPTDLLANVFLPNGTDWIQGGSVGFYSRPDASRAVIASFVVVEEAYGTQGAWTAAQDMLIAFGLSVVPDMQSMFSSNERSAPQSCEEATRIEGTESLYKVPFGLTMCQESSAAIWVVIVSGEWNGVTGTMASDALVEATLGQ
jgi:hypothetical protein